MPRKATKKTPPVDTPEPEIIEEEEVLPVKKTKKTASVDPREFTTDGDLVDIWERRMLNPNTKPAKAIRLLTPGMHIRWINLASNGRYQRARYEEGWYPVAKEELKDEREIYGVSYTSEGWVCRGEKQQEMLMKIPEAIWKKIQKTKVDDVMKSRRQIKENMQAAGARHFSDKYNSNRGSEIADSLGAFKGDVRFGSESVEPDDDDLSRVNAGLEGE